jgi:general secretion pathway protein H
MVVLGIIALLMGGVVVGMRSLAKTDLRQTASQMASSIRYLFDRARSSGKYYRMVIDLDAGRYWAEQSDNRFLLVREKRGGPQQGRGPAEDEGPDAGAQPSLTRAPSSALAGSSASAEGSDDATEEGAKLVDANGNLKLGQSKAVFKSFKESNLKPVELKKAVRVADVYTPKQREPFTSGRAYVYFFPQGFGERAIIHLSDGKDSYYSLVVHPLTGRVVVRGGYEEIPRDFDRRDDAGNQAAER